MLKEIFKQAAASGIPGGEGLLGEKGNPVYYESYGFRRIIPGPEPWEKDLFLDLASITKPLVTAHLILWFSQKGELSLHDPLGKYINSTRIGQVTLLELGTHTSGLPAWVPLYKKGAGREKMKRILFSLEAKERGKVNYSCMGYFYLGLVIEKITGKRLGEVAQEFFRSRGMELRMGRAAPAVPTELGNAYEKERAPDAEVKFREHLIEGEVHDGNSFYWGGDGGNAGAFLRAKELLKYPEIFDELADARAYALSPLAEGRSFGWEVRGSVLLHHGFTGGTLAFSPKNHRLAFLYLNRTHPKVRLKEMEKPRADFLARAFKFLKS